MNATQPIILFDGVCNLCNQSVQFIIKRDRKKKFRFGSLQSNTASQLLEQFQLTTKDLNSFVLIENGKLYTQSTAALRVAKYLDGGWKMVSVLRIIPPFIRDGIYNWIARNRYKWFGKKDACMIPAPGIKDRFLDD